MAFEKGKSGNPETQFGSGQNTRRGGRPKNALKELKALLKKRGYSNADITTAFEAILWSSLQELKALTENKETPVIIKIAALTCYKAIQEKDYRKVQAIVEQIIGKASQKVENEVTVTASEFKGFNFLPTSEE